MSFFFSFFFFFFDHFLSHPALRKRKGGISFFLKKFEFLKKKIKKKKKKMNKEMNDKIENAENFLKILERKKSFLLTEIGGLISLRNKLEETLKEDLKNHKNLKSTSFEIDYITSPALSRTLKYAEQCYQDTIKAKNDLKKDFEQTLKINDDNDDDYVLTNSGWYYENNTLKFPVPLLSPVKKVDSNTIDTSTTNDNKNIISKVTLDQVIPSNKEQVDSIIYNTPQDQYIKKDINQKKDINKKPHIGYISAKKKN